MTDEEFQKFKRKTWNAILRKLTLRDFTPKELLEKLKPWYPLEAIHEGLLKAEELGLLKPSEELAKVFARSLDKRGKSHIYIQQALRKKGLSAPASDPEVEYQKAVAALRKKIGSGRKVLSWGQIAGSLARQGFDSATIRRALKEHQSLFSKIPQDPF